MRTTTREQVHSKVLFISIVKQAVNQHARKPRLVTLIIIMGEELSDISIAQNLLKVQFPGLKSTLPQQKEVPVLERKEKIVVSQVV